ncbi:hypothetical protein NLI96_g10905 [Meripilus lineatus]|uniref:Uncharacterized protein n=1 Tax=Meripilus lineatus TaxID=2056292 RepID=A0AAD5YDS5_9APHY|nr:hypothetical protein NLI96_g10905 [Physisporinus lineatus]
MILLPKIAAPQNTTIKETGQYPREDPTMVQRTQLLLHIISSLATHAPPELNASELRKSRACQKRIDGPPMSFVFPSKEVVPGVIEL